MASLSTWHWYGTSAECFSSPFTIPHIQFQPKCPVILKTSWNLVTNFELELGNNMRLKLNSWMVGDELLQSTVISGCTGSDIIQWLQKWRALWTYLNGWSLQPVPWFGHTLSLMCWIIKFKFTLLNKSFIYFYSLFFVTMPIVKSVVEIKWNWNEHGPLNGHIIQLALAQQNIAPDWASWASPVRMGSQILRTRPSKICRYTRILDYHHDNRGVAYCWRSRTERRCH